LFLKISAKKLDTTTLNPLSYIAHTACSLDDPHPKFLPATSIFPVYFLLFKGNDSTGEPSDLYLQSLKRLSPKPILSVAFRILRGLFDPYLHYQY
jgi:hypothetical protein